MDILAAAKGPAHLLQPARLPASRHGGVWLHSKA